MTTGEFGFDEIFRQSPDGDSDVESEIPYPAVSSVLWVIFIVVMPILLTNMLVSKLSTKYCDHHISQVGLAVGDIDRIQMDASLEKLILQASLMNFSDSYWNILKVRNYLFTGKILVIILVY